jgi:hypothetical protein
MADAAFEALWKTVLDHWEEEPAHGAFLEYSGRTEQLAEAAARYRGMRGDRERSQLAERRLASIAAVAFAKLEATRSKTPAAGRRVGSLALIVTLALAVLGLLAYLSVRS